MRAATILLASLQALASASREEQYRLTLKNIYLSHGILNPRFQPDVYDYSVTLQHAHDQMAVTPEIFQTRAEYQGGEEHLPLITMKWPSNTDAKPESASVAVRKQIDLPDGGSKTLVEIVVQNPHAVGEQMSYKVTVYPADEPLTILKNLEATDENGNGVLIEPIVSQDDVVYSAFVHPNMNTVSLAVTCSEGDWVTVDGRSVQNGAATSIAREKGHHRQVVEVTCGQGSLFGKQISRNYFVGIMSDFLKKDIARPRMVVDDVGVDCRFDEEKVWYSCPNPKTRDGRTRVVGFIDPAIRYTIESPNKEVEVRVLDQIPTIPFTYRSDLSLVAVAGRFNQTWPLRFNGGWGGNWMQILGWILSGLLMLLLFVLLVVLGLSNSFGIGVPFGATEIASTMTFLLQYFCFANFLRGHSLLTNMTDSLKWVTLFWPLPWDIHSADIGEVTDIDAAYGCLYWALMLFCGCLLYHFLILVKFTCFERRHTYPHRLLFGHWECRMLHWLAFPSTVAAAMILSTSDAEVYWKVLAGCSLAFYSIWIATYFFLVKRAVRSKQVTWVWNASVREDGELEDESGYWCDVTCDQLNTQPVNRSPCKSFFPWRWISTVADIEPVSINPREYLRRGHDDDDASSHSSLYPPRAFHQATEGPTYPMAKTPKAVEVYRTRSPGVFCPGQRLISGLLRNQWLDILFTYQGLTRFHTQVMQDAHYQEEFVVPLTVKTTQLQGPIASGRYCFFFDGARVPFVKIEETIFRILLGVCLGVALSIRDYNADAACFGVAASFALASFIYTMIIQPYSRSVENWLLHAVLACISLSAWSFMGYAISGREPSTAADVFLWMTAIVCVILAIYSIVVIVSTFSAIMCPPLEETRFLEKLANCSVSVSDHNAGWTVDMPAYSKYGAKDLRAQCTHNGQKMQVSMYPSGEESTIEVQVNDLKRSCEAGVIRAPVVCLFAPNEDSALGYRHINLYEKSSVYGDIQQFLSLERTTRPCAKDVARHVAHQVEVRGRDRTVLSVTVVPPKGLALSRDEAQEVAWTSSSKHSRSGPSQSSSNTSHTPYSSSDSSSTYYQQAQHRTQGRSAQSGSSYIQMSQR